MGTLRFVLVPWLLCQGLLSGPSGAHARRCPARHRRVGLRSLLRGLPRQGVQARHLLREAFGLDERYVETLRAMNAELASSPPA